MSRLRERNSALAAGLVLLAVCACGLYFASHSVITIDLLSRRTATGAGLEAGGGALASRRGGAGDDDLTTGSILFVPTAGNVCRQRLIDNRTWLMRDAGHVVCDEAVSWHASGSSVRKPYTATSRVEAIRDGFFRK